MFKSLQLSRNGCASSAQASSGLKAGSSSLLLLLLLAAGCFHPASDSLSFSSLIVLRVATSSPPRPSPLQLEETVAGTRLHVVLHTGKSTVPAQLSQTGCVQARQIYTRSLV
ncbi:hypothetical protein GQ53DRAFT_39391 [Thozetella sp. PMI_491]|nr:hypothetical protein GQ53DRAFT_39391 [Thozetella sp. PMI_491]